MANSTTFDRVQAPAAPDASEPHTPGPFARYGVMIRDTVETVGGMFCIRTARAVKSVTGRPMFTHGNCVGYAYTRADADLMAAAPALLAALRELQQHIVHDDEGDLTGAEFDAMTARADAAIAAAEGRADG